MRLRLAVLLVLAAAVPVSGYAVAGPGPLSLERRDTGWRLQWPADAEAGWYQLESTDSLNPAAWTPAGPPTTNTTADLPSRTDTARFFRLTSVPAARGGLLSATFLRQYTEADMRAVFAAYRLAGIPPIPVNALRLRYLTVDPQGATTYASALLVSPVTPAGPLPLASYQHGTVTRRDDVPSRLNTEAAVGLIMAASGYLAVCPDYLGLGDSPGRHPYHHAATHASAVVDALRAARAWAADQQVALNGQLFLTGYSQGGHATLAAQRDLELRHADEFTITASAPGAGAYDLSGIALDDFLSDRRPPNPYYPLYLLASYVEVYGLASSVGALLREPYRTTLPPLLDGTHDAAEINAALPALPRDAFDPAFIEALRTNPDHPLRVAVRENDLYRGWAPRSPTRFHHCSGDQDVLPAHTQLAYTAFLAADAPVEREDRLPALDHPNCAPFALLATKLWFDERKR